MKTLVAIFVMVMSFGAGPTTGPATRESNIPKIMAELRREIAALKDRITTLEKENADLRASNEAVKKELASKAGLKSIDERAIQQGIEKHELVIGMTLEQATEAMMKNCGSPYRVGADGPETTYQWIEGKAVTFGVFQGGRLVRFMPG